MGRRRHRRRRQHRASDHGQPHHRRRPDGRHAVQHRPPGRGTCRRRPDARPHRARHARKNGPRSSARRACSKAARSTARSIASPSTSIRGSGCGSPTRRSRMPGVAGAEQLGRVRRGGARAREGRQDPARHRRPALADDRRLQRADPGDRRQGRLPEGLQGPRCGGGRRARDRQGLQGRGRRAQDVGEVERAGLEPGDQSRHHRPGRRTDHGRLGAGRVPGCRPGRRQGLYLPAGPRRQRAHLDRRRLLLLPEARRPGEERRRRRCWPRRCSAPPRRSPST